MTCPNRQSKDTWSVFKIMGEFVEGFETLRPVWPSVSIFGSARVRQGEPTTTTGTPCRIAEALSKRRVLDHHRRRGPGIMEAANRGARRAGGTPIGLNIKLPVRAEAEPPRRSPWIHFNYFFARKVMFVKYACGFVGLPGGFGTLDEIFEALTLRQTGKIHDFPVVLFGREFWGGLLEWVEKRLLAERMISKRDFNLIQVTDDAAEVAQIIQQHYAKRMRKRGPRGGNGRDTP